MSDTNRMIAIAIAVADSVPPKYLAGAINCARSFEKWASSQGYETVLVTDEEVGVTMAVLRNRIEGLLKASNKPIHRIIVYFVGHGLIREVEEGLWLMSDWRSELRAVAVEGLKRRLTMYGPRQICIISDACRSLPSDIVQADLVPDAVLGAGPKPADMTVAIDKFIAAQDGTEAFMIPGENPNDDRCLFSGVLVEGLWGLPGLQEKPFSKLVPDKVTSRSLGAYLLAEVPARANEYELTLTPTISPTFPEGDDYYFSGYPSAAPPKFPPWPPKGKLAGRKSQSTDREINFAVGPNIIGLVLGVGIGTATIHGNGHGVELPSKPTPILRQVSAQVLRPPGHGVLSGVAVSGAGAGARRLWLGEHALARKIARVDSWSIRQRGLRILGLPTPALLEFLDGRFAGIVALPDLFTSVVRDQFGVTGIVHHDLRMHSIFAAPVEAALAALDRAALRADAATDLAVQLRIKKHSNPVLGVISAYLYDAIGDIDSIRRMASFYAMYDEAIPYDIALLGGLRGERKEHGFVVEIPEVKKRTPRTKAEREHSWTHCRMKARTGLVGGLWPWMRQGWTFLDDAGDVSSPLILPGLVDLRSGLMRSRFTTFEKDAALALARLCGLQPWPPARRAL
jgi:hypothetical protein